MEERNEASENQDRQQASGELEGLRAQVESQSKRIDELSRAYAEVLNDRESFRKRLERERDRQLESARGDIAQALLEAIDDLHRALQSGTHDAAALAEGVRLIADGLQRRTEAMGLTRVLAAGHAFDPVQHEAVDLVPVPDRDADGLVIEEVRSGWKSGERVVRPARVRVGRFVEPPDASGSLPN